MKTNQLVSGFAVAVFGLVCAGANAGEVASVTQNHVNVRGQPSLTGEVITQLQKGEKAIILEEIPVEKPKKGEPAKWARIQMPANTPVWVFGPYIDANSKSVTVPRVNLRGGPGENFSVIGRLERGDTVKEIRRMEDWIEIETPDKAYAYVAMNFLAKAESAPAPATPKTEPDRTGVPPVATVPADQVASARKETPIAETVPSSTEKPSNLPTLSPPANPTAVAETTPAVSNPVSTDQTTAPTPPPPNAATPTPAVVAPPQSTERPAADAGPLPKRIVRREGVVRGTKSIQAPTYFELVSPDTRKVINYLHTLDPELKLKDYRGRKIVITGEEGIDARWPNTPILEAETIELAP